MDSKAELRKPLLRRKPLSRKIPRDYRGRPLAISEDKVDLLLQLPIHWNKIYKKFALTVCLLYPLAMGMCMYLCWFISFMFNFMHCEDLRYIKTDIFEIPQAKYFAIGYAVLVFFSYLISLLFLNEQTHINFQFWQRYRDMKNIKIEYEEDWFKYKMEFETMEFKTEVYITYTCPEMGCASVKLFFVTFLPYLVAVILIGSKLMILGLIMSGIAGAWLLGFFVYPVRFAFDEAIFDLLTAENQVV